MAGNEVRPFHLDVDQAALEDLKDRLRLARWPDRETAPGGEQGIGLEAVQALCAYWLKDYDWRRCERRLNGFGQFRAVLDGLDFHFLHARSPELNALPLIITHGWPGSVIEFHKVIGPLADPRAHGGDPRDAFHVVAPSLPGYGFSEKPRAPGWTTQRIADAWIELMRRLGYHRFVAQGGDWGSVITTRMAATAPPELAAIHLNAVPAHPTSEDLKSLTPAEQETLDGWAHFQKTGTGYSAIQSTRPQTLGYGLTDSPVGQAAWILEKFTDYADTGGDLASVLTYDEILDNIMLYWLPGTATSSARLYWESLATPLPEGQITVPTGATIFPKEVVRPSRRWAERKFANIIHWNEVPRGGHFAAFEQPDLFVEELRACFRLAR